MMPIARYREPAWQEPPTPLRARAAAPGAAAQAAIGPPIPSEVWSANELLQRAAAPKADIHLCGWVRPMSVSYKQLVVEVRAYHAMWAQAAFRQPGLNGREVRAQLGRLSVQLGGISASVQAYLEHRGHSRRRAIEAFGRTVQAERELLARTWVLLPGEEDPPQDLTLADSMERARRTANLPSPAAQDFYDHLLSAQVR